MKKIDSMRELLKHSLYIDSEGNIMGGWREGYAIQDRLTKRLKRRVRELLKE